MLVVPPDSVKDAQVIIDKWNKEHAYLPKCLWTDELAKMLNPVQVAYVLLLTDKVCLQCWDSTMPCQCRNDE